MNQPLHTKPLFYVLSAVTVLCLIYLLSVFGLFDGYAHFFGKNHPHKWHTLFRVCFVLSFAVANHGFLVPRLYIPKLYILYFSIVLICLVGLWILPDFLLKPPKLELYNLNLPKLVASQPPMFPMRTLLFELAHVYLLFFISTFTSIAIRTQQYMQQIKQKHQQQMEQQQIRQRQFTAENMEETTVETTAIDNPIETALTITVNYSRVRIEFADILFIKSMGNYLQFFLKDKKPILVRMTLKEATDKLPNAIFLRVHKSYIVAIAQIDNIRNKTIQIGKQHIAIGRAYEETLFKMFEK